MRAQHQTACLIAALVAACLLLPGCSRAPTDSMKSARDAIAANDSAAAVIHLRNLLAAEPDNAEARYLLGLQAMQLADYAAAVVDLKRARELKIGDDKVVPPLSEAMLYARQEKLLVEQLGPARLGDATSQARLQTNLGLAYLALGSAAKGRQAVEAALAAAPGLPEALLARARITLSEQGATAALAEAEALVRDAPRHDAAWSFLGSLHFGRPGGQSEALQAFAKALEINPRQFQALFSIVAVHLAARDLEKAKAALATLSKQWPGSMYGRYLEARILLAEGQYEQARPIFAQLRNGMPANVALLLASAINELQLKAPIQAEALLAQAVSLEPENTSARYFLAQANLQLGRPERASQALAPLVDKGQPSPEILVLAAQARLFQGDPRGASDLYARAEKFKSADPTVRTALAMAKVAKGEVDVAMRELQQISAGTQETDADLKLISTRLSRGELKEALAAIDTLDRKQPGQAANQELRGQVLLKQGRVADARAAFERALSADKQYVPAIAQMTNLDVQEGRSDAAVARIEGALKAMPEQSRLLTMLAAVRARTGGDSREVLSLLERATRADSRDLDAWLALISRHYQAGDLQAALASAQTANALLPDNVQLLEMTGRIQLRAGDTRQAAGTFVKLIAIAPRSPSGYMGQAATLVATNELEAAAGVLGRLMELDPESLDAPRLAADVAMRRKRPQEALALARDLQRRHPGHAAGFRLEGTVEQARGNLPAAIAAFRRALDKADAADVPVRVYEALRKAGNAAEADSFAAAWTKANPKDVSLPVYQGYLRMQLKDHAGARERFERALAVEPDHVEALNNLALVMIDLKDPAQAQTLVERALKVQPNRPELLDTLAQTYVSRGQYTPAVEALKRAINRSTDTAPLRLALAKVYIQAGDRANATAELDALVALGRRSSTFAEARALLAGQRQR